MTKEQKMDIDFEKIEELVARLAGKDTVELSKLIIEGKENVSEFLLAEKLELGINLVRNRLYRLQKHNLVSSMRKKDKQKGWYIYYWTFNLVQAKLLIKSLKEEEIGSLKKRLKKEEEDHYTCSRKCLRLNFMNSMDNDFKCPLCEGMLAQSNNKKIIKEIKKELEVLLEEPCEKVAA